MAPITTSQQITTIIAIAGFLFSFSTTIAAILRTRKQDIQTSRKELRELLERLIAIPREKIDATKKYMGDEAALFAFDQICNQENTLLSRQAAEVAKRLGSKYVSATEYLSIGYALQRAYNLQGAREFLELASNSATDFNDKIAAIRTLGYIYYTLGKPEDGRARFHEASQIFNNYPAYDQFTKVSTNIQTQLNWSFAEASVHSMSAAAEHLDQAEAFVHDLPYSPGTEGWKMQVAQARQQFERSKMSGVVQPFSQSQIP